MLFIPIPGKQRANEGFSVGQLSKVERRPDGLGVILPKQFIYLSNLKSSQVAKLFNTRGRPNLKLFIVTVPLCAGHGNKMLALAMNYSLVSDFVSML